MWQERESDPGFIIGQVDYQNVDRSGGYFMDIIQVSKASCVISDDIANITDLYPAPSEGTLELEFNSTELKAYNKAEIHINLIFVDNNTTAWLISVHQDQKTFVLPNSLALSRFRRNFLKKFNLENYF